MPSWNEKQITKSQDGSSLLMTVISLSIISIASLSTASIFNQVISTQERAKTHNSLGLIRSNVMSNIFSSFTWDYLASRVQSTVETTAIKDIAAVTCSDNTPGCLHFSGQLGLLNADGESYYEGSLPNQGFNRNGDVCNEYNGTSGHGSDSCPIKVTIQWEVTCPPPPALYDVNQPTPNCPLPAVKVNVKFQYSGSDHSNRISVNAEKYNLSFMR